MAAVEGCQDPGFCWVEVDAFYSFATGEELALEVESDFSAHSRQRVGLRGGGGGVITFTSNRILTAGPYCGMACKGPELSSVRLMRCGAIVNRYASNADVTKSLV